MPTQTHWYSKRVTVHQELEYRREKAKIALFYEKVGELSMVSEIRERLIRGW